MHVIEIIQKKRDKLSLTKEEIQCLINKYVAQSIPDYQMAAFLMSVCINGMNDDEIAWLTDAMLFSGEVIKHTNTGRPLIDKHSTGGVGDKISIPLAPIAAACGLSVPMIAGRGLGHTGGTLDKLEAIPGFMCNLSADHYRRQVEKVGCVIMGQTKEIAPADKVIYSLRDVTGTVESIPLIASSIMSKKMAEGIDGLVLDVKFGSGAFMGTLDKARALALAMVKIGESLGKKVTTCLTNMDQPLGRMVGNSLEIIESIEILKGDGPRDSTQLTIEFGAEMLMMGNLAPSLDEGRKQMNEAIRSGKALEKFAEMVQGQGGDARFVHQPSLFRRAPEKVDVRAPQSGYLAGMDSRAIGTASALLGGGRFLLTDEINPCVGVEVHCKIGDKIEINQPIFTLHVDGKGLDEALARCQKSITISEQEVSAPQLCQERITSK
jgi:pyrimidine-nucleoside phosphorylase